MTFGIVGLGRMGLSLGEPGELHRADEDEERG
jgi:6-phosphogluconate dehydrogenase (decarboxylating)